MPLNFQFAFLGCGHNYLGRVIRVSDDGIPQENECLPETFGLPEAFSKKLCKKSYSNLFLFNIRGHDFLSHYGEWKDSENRHGYLKTSSSSVSEVALLQPLRAELEKNGHDGLEMIIRFGPQASSFFVDITAPGMERYKSHNLAQVAYGLDDVIQRSRDAHGYGDIREVMMNAVGGWIVLFRKGMEGEKFAFGGKLPLRLAGVLAKAQEAHRARRGSLFGPKMDHTIYRIYLNHQNPDEYVLLFNDGRCYASLHGDFRGQLESLVSAWATGNGIPNFAFHFTSSSGCPEDARKKQNASYYSRRGLFHLSRGNTELGLEYLREASKEHENDTTIERHLAMAVVAAHQERGSNQIPHARKSGPPRPGNQDEDTLLRNEYMWVIDENYNIEKLKTEFEELKRQQVAATRNGVFNEWSYEKTLAGNEVHEAPVAQFTRTEGEADKIIEMEGDNHHVVRAISHELSVESSRSSGDNAADGKNTGPNGSTEKYSHDILNGPQKKSRMLSKFSHRFKHHDRME